ncbi:MAG: TlpA family protein disulfide reductase [Actinobacteria bacterium]|nr:TlpA family protein disulfide reductase [Actinomycetota bacterium]
MAGTKSFSPSESRPLRRHGSTGPTAMMNNIVMPIGTVSWSKNGSPTTIDDQTFDLARRKGSWVVLNFFNSTCVPCIAEHPTLVEFARGESTRADGVELYTVVNDDADAAVRDFFAANGGDWPKLRDADGAIAVAFGVAKVPETWIIDPNGFVRLRIIGQLAGGVLESQMTRLREASSS